jgi:hypothetical protein
MAVPSVALGRATTTARLRLPSKVDAPNDGGGKESGCSTGCLLLSVPVSIIGVVAIFFLITGFAESLARKLIAALGPQTIELFFAVVLLALSGTGLARGLRGRWGADLTGRQQVMAAVILVGMAALGILLLIHVIAQSS